jgi:hypothetical protein
MKHPDIIVVGTGRSGTSTVARILQEHFKIRMAYNWDNEPHNPLGSYEEQKMIAETNALVSGCLSVQGWLQRYNEVYKTGSSYTGIKQTALSMCTKQQWKALAPSLVFRTYRPAMPTISSMLKWREPKDRSYWKNFYCGREEKMMWGLDSAKHNFPVLTIDFTKFQPDEMIIEQLKPWIEMLYDGRL